MKVASLVATLFGLLLLGQLDAKLLLAGAKNLPVSKVITLLRDMQGTLEKEAEQDEEVHDKFMCWCNTNDRSKTMTIKEAEARIADLTSTIESTAAQSARLTAEIAGHEDDLVKSTRSLDTLTSLREKQAVEFQEEEKDMIQSVKALEAAIIVISRHHAANAVLLDESTLRDLSEVVREQLRQHETLLQGVISPNKRRIFLNLVQDSQNVATAFRQVPSGPAYQPQSSEIFGILRQMKETFSGNLEESQKEELSNSQAFVAQKEAKQGEINAIQGALEEKQQQLAECDEKNAQSKEDIEDTRASLSGDDEFLINLKKRCKETQEEWEYRSKMRQAEISAVLEAISILSEDAAHDTFSKTFNPAFFFQKERRIQSRRQNDAAKVLRAAATKARDPRLSMLAARTGLDVFTKVKEAIDQMVVELSSEKEEEIKHRDTCVSQLNENTRTTEREERERSDLETKVDGLKTTITELDRALETLNSEIEDMQLQIKRAGEDRELENKDFQSTVTDQREAQKLLQRAVVVLKAVYAKKMVSQVQTRDSVQVRKADPPPEPEGFKPYEENRASGGVVEMIQTIIHDAELMELEVVKDEQAAQEKYESFVRDTNVALTSKQQGIVNKREDKAKAEGGLNEKKVELAQATTEMENLSNNANALHQSCDFIVRNFDVRQQARDEEIEALKQAKAILAGMKLD